MSPAFMKRSYARASLTYAFSALLTFFDMDACFEAVPQEHNSSSSSSSSTTIRGTESHTNGIECGASQYYEY